MSSAAGTVTSSIPSLPPLTYSRWSFTGHFDIAFQPAASSFPFTPQAGAPTSTFTMTRQTVNGIGLAPGTTLQHRSVMPSCARDDNVIGMTM